MTVGAAVSMRGIVTDSPGKGQEKEFKAEWVEIVGESDAEVCGPPVPSQPRS